MCMFTYTSNPSTRLIGGDPPCQNKNCGRQIKSQIEVTVTVRVLALVLALVIVVIVIVIISNSNN